MDIILAKEFYLFLILSVFGILLISEISRSPSRYGANISTWGFNDAMMSLLSVTFVYSVANKYSSGILDGFGIFGMILALILYDLLIYLSHRASHSFDFLWIFHRVHHCDEKMNVSTAFRVHLVEIIISTIYKIAFMLVAGVSLSTMYMIEALVTTNVLIYHSKTVPGCHRLSWLIVTPDMHRTHHSVARSEHDNNYGALFSIWDRVFGTLLLVKPQSIGLNRFDDMTFVDLLLLGFGIERPQHIIKSAVVSKPIISKPSYNVNSMIAEAAYYRAEKRNFKPGYEMFDWFEAEK